MFKRIVVPVDLSDKSTRGVDAAFDLARLTGAEVILLHVIEVIEHVEADELKPFYHRLETSAGRRLRELSERFEAEDLQVDHATVYGHRMSGIIEFAIQKQADLLIMASHRMDADRPGHDWNSISYSGAVLAPCSVLLVK
jgi:nucleotide-binding universal stress UspA family protein